MSGKTACIVGLGNIGRLLVDRLRPFGMRILATDHHPDRAPADVKAFSSERLHAAVAEADYVVVCARAGKENENLIDRTAMEAMKRGAILVNIARGSLIDENALYDVVKSGHIAAAGLDVLKSSPDGARSPLFDLPQILIRLSAGPAVNGPHALSSTLAGHEKAISEDALRASGGRVYGPSGAAARLGIARSTVESKIRTLGIKKSRFRGRPPKE